MWECDCNPIHLAPCEKKKKKDLDISWDVNYFWKRVKLGQTYFGDSTQLLSMVLQFKKISGLTSLWRVTMPIMGYIPHCLFWLCSFMFNFALIYFESISLLCILWELDFLVSLSSSGTAQLPFWIPALVGFYCCCCWVFFFLSFIYSVHFQSTPAWLLVCGCIPVRVSSSYPLLTSPEGGTRAWRH